MATVLKDLFDNDVAAKACHKFFTLIFICEACWKIQEDGQYFVTYYLNLDLLTKYEVLEETILNFYSCENEDSSDIRVWKTEVNGGEYNDLEAHISPPE